MKRLALAVSITALSAVCSAADLSEAAQAQQQAISSQDQRDALEAQGRSLEDSLKEKLAQLNRELFKAAQQAGIQVVPTQRAIAELNRQQEASGVWGYSVKESDDGYFAILADPLTRTYDSAFAVKAYGLVIASGYVRDNNLQASGEFSPDCAFEVYLGRHSEKFSCTQFLGGAIDSQVLDSMKAMLATEIKEKSGA